MWARPPTLRSEAPGIGTIPVFATVTDSKLSYTVKPKTKGIGAACLRKSTEAENLDSPAG